jgi:hypothetical protein
MACRFCEEALDRYRRFLHGVTPLADDSVESQQLRQGSLARASTTEVVRGRRDKGLKGDAVRAVAAPSAMRVVQHPVGFSKAGAKRPSPNVDVAA